ncbi:MAG TPA: hypothetical protein VH988_02085 [Thermoanaerobaculia bacterium]|jgi:hypothetical protein|nr:hypothetical protein [Thermoanaerobaculia bacterium]
MLIKRLGQNFQEEALRKYFARIERGKRLPGLILIGLGSLLLVTLMSTIDATGINLSWSNWLGLLLIILGIVQIAGVEILYFIRTREAQPKPPDSQVQQWLDEGTRSVILHSRFALNLAEEESSISDPLVIITPRLNTAGRSDQDWTLWKLGDDGQLRFGYYKMIVIRLTERHLGAYVCDYDFVRDVALNEATHELHYCDIVSVFTQEQSDPYNLPTGKKLRTQQEFVLSVASGETIRVSVDTAQIRQITGVEAPPELGAESAVAQIRSALRGYKALSAAA